MRGVFIAEEDDYKKYYIDCIFDLILESESVCYIDIDKGFKKAREVLRDGGYVLASDYFVFFKDHSKSLHFKSSHDMYTYLKSAKENGANTVKFQYWDPAHLKSGVWDTDVKLSN